MKTQLNDDGTHKMPFSINHMRLPGDNKAYWMHKLQAFSNLLAEYQVKSVAFGKMDIRGTVSIWLFDHNHCVPKQLHFANRDALLGYVQGYVDAHSGSYDTWEAFKPRKEA
jgi:hypothetical protein